MVVDLLKALVNQAGAIVLVAVLLSRFNFFRQLITSEKLPLKNLVILTVFFSIFGIVGTYFGIPVKGALANSRVVGVFVGGLIGGPAVGILSGLIAGVHRWAIDIGGFTAFACMIATICEGALAGYLSSSFYKSEKKWLFAFWAGIAAETMQMTLLLILVKPFADAMELVKIIGIPMIIANAVGISMFIAIVDIIFKEHDRIAANQSRTVLQIANRTINLFRKGLTESTAFEAAGIIKEMTGVDAVSFTCRDKILAHVGSGSDHHIPGCSLMTELTQKVIKLGVTEVAESKKDIACSNPGCTLGCVVTVPLKSDTAVIGTLKLYRVQENSITPVEIQLAEGLASLFSTQIELSRIEEQDKLLNQAELKALQAQINPHFLFNAMNTIVSLIRTKPAKARDLMVNLGSYLRTNINQPEEIPFTEEIENVKHYLEIEKARFGKKLNIILNIPDGLNFPIPPFTLQPLVENALKHGLLPRITGGTIEISAKKNGKNYYLTVKDDGIGIPVNKVPELLDDFINTGSIGLKNVNKRLICRYGSTFGLQLKSTPGIGTAVSVVIPAGEK